MKRRILMGMLLVLLAACTATESPVEQPVDAPPTATLSAPTAAPTQAPTATPIPPTQTSRPLPYSPTVPDEPCEPSETRACTVLFIVPQQDFNFIEYQRRGTFERWGYTVVLASQSTDPATGYEADSQIVYPDLALADVDVADYDAVFYVGGEGTGNLVGDSDAARVAREALAQGKVVVGQCNGVGVLAEFGVLSGRTIVTPYRGYCEVLAESFGVICGRGDVARDGPIVTSTGAQTEIVYATIAAIEELIP